MPFASKIEHLNNAQDSTETNSDFQMEIQKWEIE